MAQLVECLCNAQESSEFHVYHHISQTWQLKPVIPVPGKGRHVASGIQGHTHRHSRFETNLEYRRVYSRCAKETNCEGKNHTCLY